MHKTLASLAVLVLLSAPAVSQVVYLESRSTSGLGFDGPDVGLRVEYEPTSWIRLEGAGFSSQKVEVQDHGRGSLVEGSLVAAYPWRRWYTGGAFAYSRLDTGRWSKSGEGLEGVVGWRSPETRIEARIAEDADYWYATYRQRLVHRLMLRLEYGRQDFRTGAEDRTGSWLSVGVGWEFH